MRKQLIEYKFYTSFLEDNCMNNCSYSFFKNYFFCLLRFSSSSNSINEAFNITTQVWKALILYNKNDTLTEFRNKFPLSMNLYNEANIKISQGNLNDYINLMTQILCKIEQGDDHCLSSISFNISVLFIFGGLILAALYLHTRRVFSIKISGI